MTKQVHYDILDKRGTDERECVLCAESAPLQEEKYALHKVIDFVEKGAIDILLIREVEYAVMVLDELHKESPLSAAELSERRNIPSPFIYRVLKKLEAAEILDIKRGAKGGYSIRKNCDDLTLYDVICAFENTFLVIECMKKHYDCSRNRDLGCCMHREFGRIQGLLRNEFKRNSLAVLFSE